MAKKPPKPKGPTPVESIRHKDSRINIPTEELRDFVAQDEQAPAKMRYPRDPSLDPQLVWKGKDEGHLRHEPRCARARTHAADGRQVSVLPSRRFA